MAEVTVTQFAEVLKVPVDKLLLQRISQPMPTDGDA